MPFSERIKALQEKSGMTTAELAEAAKLPVDTITKIRTGTTRTPSTDTLMRLAAAFNISLSDLIGDCPIPTAKPPENDVAAAYEAAMYLQVERYDRRVDALVKDRDRWRQIAFIMVAICAVVLLANLAVLIFMYWDLMHPDAGKILYEAGTYPLG